MKVNCIFTLNELKKIVPSITIEHFKSDNPKVKEALKKLFWNMGCGAFGDIGFFQEYLHLGTCANWDMEDS